MADALYQELADRIGNLIRGGTFASGSRLPSVRRLSREQNVSVTTVLEAYGRLEGLGIIESRPRSGYFVCPPKVVNGQLPRPAAAPKRPVAVRSPEIFQAVMEAATDPGIVPFGAAVPGDETIPAKRLTSIASSLARRLGPGVYQYSMVPGRHELRAAVSRRLLSAGVQVTPDEIIATQGASEALALALRATTRRGDVIAVEAPTYFGILHLARDMGLEVLEVPMDASEGMDLNALEELSGRHPIKACVVQPVFQNPVGSRMSDTAKQRLAEIARQRDFAIIEDDLYGELGHSGTRPMAVAHYDTDGRVLLCGSVSKCIAPGLRIGWIVPGRYLDQVKRLKTTHSLANPTLSELVVAEYFRSGAAERQLRRISSLFAAQCARMREAVLREFPEGTRVNQPRGGFVIWVEMPEGYDAEKLAAEALQQGIGLIPGTIFSASCRLQNCLRLSCGSRWDERSEHAVRTLGRLASHCRVDDPA
ncbi:DNA-binding transcriptional MocR family regulator [Haloferula luteola]|uniref:DNA-binding transcriptional MocR family regulator n=1 Tax=Haloferula luteola TaxID=595692 RepID=A0A840UVR6_9BACT|nr:PLP-dependent aminotransferase family protein [Haloferula luteola]MBB5350277.1 DNA-binding transcriptional MocR family regulator [Haloferula luteola]